MIPFSSALFVCINFKTVSWIAHNDLSLKAELLGAIYVVIGAITSMDLLVMDVSKVAKKLCDDIMWSEW